VQEKWGTCSVLNNPRAGRAPSLFDGEGGMKEGSSLLTLHHISPPFRLSNG
jgi:hypothetical protein